MPCKFGGSVKLPGFMSHLVCYYKKNADKMVNEPVGMRKPDPDAGKDDTLLPLVNQVCLSLQYQIVNIEWIFLPFCLVAD